MKHLSIAVKQHATIVFLSLFCAASWANDRVIVVQPSAGVEGIQRALQSARELRRQSPGTSGPIRIVLQSGEYLAASGPLRITPEDSGTADSPTIIESQVAGGAIIVGAPALRPVDATAPSKWTFRPASRPGSTEERAGGQLFINGQRAVLARHPNKDQYFFVDKPRLADNMQEASKASFTLSATDAQALTSMTEGHLDRSMLTVMQSWSTGNHRLASIQTGGVVTVSPAARWGFLNFGQSQRVYVKNTPKALDAAGEWVATGGVLEYLRRGNDSSTSPEARWPRTPTLVTVAGNLSQGVMVEHVRLIGIALAYTGELTPTAGWVGTQAAADISAALVVDGARNFMLSNCSISSTGGYGVWLRRAVQQSTISNCNMTDLGAGAIKVGEAQLSNAANSTGRNTIQGNRISWTGQEFPDAVGIWVGHSSNNSIRSNLIQNTSYTGISVGWQWGYAESSASNNDISNNVLLDIGLGQLSDLGAIYTLGRSPGTVISGNFIRNVTAYSGYGPGGWGIYNDEGSSNISVTGNVVLDTDSGGYHLHYGENITVENNLFARSKKSELRWTAPSRSGSLSLIRNGILNDQARWFDINGSTYSLISLGNTINGVLQGPLRVASSSTAANVLVSGGSTEQSRIWSATVVNAQNLAGSQTLAASVQRMVKADNDVWAVNLDLIPVGGRPIDVKHFPKTPAMAMSVVNDGTGSKAIHLYDGLSGMARHDPHFYFPVSVDDGVSVSRFTLRPDPNAELIHEWRDADFAFNTGPKVTITRSRLVVGDRVVAVLPSNTWVEIEVRQDLSNKTGQWTMRWRTVSPTVSSWASLGPYAAAGKSVPDRWRWVGWYSHGTAISSSMIKGIEFKRTGP